jgi:hypothetical protein
VTFALDLIAKVLAAHSIDETATAFWEWMNQHIELAGQDGARLSSGTKECIENWMRFLGGGFSDPEIPVNVLSKSTGS